MPRLGDDMFTRKPTNLSPSTKSEAIFEKPKVTPFDWKDRAHNDPLIKKWYNQLLQDNPNLKDVDMIKFMEEEMVRGDGFDYKKALEEGNTPYVEIDSQRIYWKGLNEPLRSDVGRVDVPYPPPKKGGFLDKFVTGLSEFIPGGEIIPELIPKKEGSFYERHWPQFAGISEEAGRVLPQREKVYEAITKITGNPQAAFFFMEGLGKGTYSVANRIVESLNEKQKQDLGAVLTFYTQMDGTEKLQEYMTDQVGWMMFGGERGGAFMETLRLAGAGAKGVVKGGWWATKGVGKGMGEVAAQTMKIPTGGGKTLGKTLEKITDAAGAKYQKIAKPGVDWLYEKMLSNPASNWVYRNFIPAVDRIRMPDGSQAHFRAMRKAESDAIVYGKMVQTKVDKMNPRERFAFNFYLGESRIPENLHLTTTSRNKIREAHTYVNKLLDPTSLHAYSPKQKQMYVDSLREQLTKRFSKPLFQGMNQQIEEVTHFQLLRQVEDALYSKVSPDASLGKIRHVLRTMIKTPGLNPQERNLAAALYDSTADTLPNLQKSVFKSAKDLIYSEIAAGKDMYPMLKTIKGKNVLQRQRAGFQMADPKKMPEFEGMYIQQDVWDALDDIHFVEAYSHKFLDRILLTPWKQGKILLRPATHFRNLFSNVILNDWGGLPFYRFDVYHEALKRMQLGDDVFREFQNLTHINVTWTSAEMSPMLGLRHDMKMWEWIPYVMDRTVSATGAGRLYQMNETWFKFAKYIHNVSKGLDKGHAAVDAVKWTFDYGTSTPLARQIRQTTLPFFTWQSKVIPTMVETAVNHPLRFAKWPMFFTGMSMGAVEAVGMNEMEWEQVQKTLPDYIKKGMFYMLPFRDSRGRLQFINMTYMFPGLGDVAELQSNSMAHWFFQHPAVSIAGSLLTNKQFGGHPIYFDWEPAHLKAGKSLAYIGKQLLPSFTPGIGVDWEMWEKVLSEDPNSLTPEMAMAATFGLKTYPADINKLRARKRSLEKVYSQEIRGELMRALRKAKTPQQRESTLKRYSDLLRKVGIDEEE